MTVHDQDARTHQGQVRRLHARAVARLPMLKGRLTLGAFTEAIERSVTHRFKDDRPAPSAVAHYIDSLHTEDLALACACEAGDEGAWDHMMMIQRPILYRAASILSGGDDAGRELADTLWAELYGVGHTRASLESGAPRRSLFRYFHGRSQLSTWLRSILAQRHVDVVRAHRRTESLDATPGADPREEVSRVATVSDPDGPQYVAMFRAALDEVLRALDSSDRLRLGYYYGQGRTLAEIGRLAGEHEATVSRKLNRTRTRIRAEVERLLHDRHHLAPTEIERCYQYVVTDPSVDLEPLLEP